MVKNKHGMIGSEIKYQGKQCKVIYYNFEGYRFYMILGNIKGITFEQKFRYKFQDLTVENFLIQFEPWIKKSKLK